MTEPSPSPVPTTSSNPSWLDWSGPLDDLLANHHSIAVIFAALITATVSGIGWVLIQAWRKWQQWWSQQRIASRRQQLPPVLLPFTVEIGNQQLTLNPAQPQQNSAPEGKEIGIVRLLGAESTPTPFLDRAGALARLETWARSEERFAIHVLGGDSGSGKTRLGVELCRRLDAPGFHRQGNESWKAGLLQDDEDPTNTKPIDNTSSLLLVVDYAEARPKTVKNVINAAYRAAEDPQRRRVRIVFLVRRPSPLSAFHRSSNMWLDALRPQDSNGNEGLNRLLDGASTTILNDEELSDIERRELFNRAYRSFTNSPESTPSPNLIGRLSNPIYSQPLLVIVDAFLNAQTHPNSQTNYPPSELFEGVLCHEEHYWDKHWPPSLATNISQDQQSDGTATPNTPQTKKTKSLDPELARQAVAAATLTNILDEEDAISLLNLLPANPGKNTKALAKWLRDCYPPRMNSNRQSTLWCEHLEPDRIGEHLIASESNHLAPLLQELLSPSRVGTSSLRTWTVLERASTDPHLNERVGRILNDVLVEVTQEVHTQTVKSQNPDLAAAFAKFFSAVCSHIDPNKAHEAAQPLSDSGYFTTLLEFELAQCAANINRPADDAPEADRATYASRRLSLSRSLAASGRSNKALQIAQEATNLYRTLAEQNPATYTPSLVRSLNILDSRLAEQGRLDEALQTAQEATALSRTLAEHNPAIYTPDLAASLNALAVYLDRNGQQREALQTAQEATTLYQTLAEHNPAAYTPDLAASLNNLASYLDSNGQPPEPLTIAQKATTLYRTLAEHNPAAYTPDLAMSLNNLAIYLASNGQQREAIQTAQEATTLYRTLAEYNPAAYTPNLAGSLNNLASYLEKNGQQREALQTAQEAVTIRRNLVEHNPAAYTPNLATALNTYANILERSGNTKEAARIRKERNAVLKRMKDLEEGDA